MMMFDMRRSVAATLAALLAVLALATSALAEVKIQKVTSPKGVRAWLVEDYTVPIISIRLAFRGGSTQDPAGKEGLANLMTGLFDEGAGEMDSDAFQLALDDAGAEMSFSAGSDGIFGAMRMLADNQTQAFSLLRQAILSPRFDQAPIDRIRAQIAAGIEASARDPGQMSQVAWREAIYAGHPYSRPGEGTLESLAAITRDDLVSFHKRQFARDNLFVGVVGAISAEELKARLDQLFGDLPEKAEMAKIDRATPKLGQEIRVDYDLPQTSIYLSWAGIQRDDPEFFAAYLMNHILGGGTFSSRLFTEIREKRGLAYGVDSALVNRDFDSSLQISTATRADRATETLSIIRAEAKRMAEAGPTPEELDFAKKYVIGAYAINNLDSSAAIARTLVQLQMDDLGIDYIQRRVEQIDAVTLDQVKAAAKRLLNPEPAVMLVGPVAKAAQ
ncbi:MAG: insulinase family protein [Proteobacteria bacterium]|nr:insulinase family protein [Pseudomonadota bacterium]